MILEKQYLVPGVRTEVHECAEQQEAERRELHGSAHGPCRRDISVARVSRTGRVHGFSVLHGACRAQHGECPSAARVIVRGVFEHFLSVARGVFIFCTGSATSFF